MRRKIVEVRCTFGTFKTWEEAEAAFINLPRYAQEGGISRYCTIIWDNPKESKFWKFLGYLFASAVIITNIIGWFIAFPEIIGALMTKTIPGLKDSVKKLGGWVYGKLAPEGSFLRKGFDGLKSIYDNYIEPTLDFVYNQVKKISESIYTTYNLTIGGIVQTYNDLFGWVDGVRTTINSMLDKATGLIAVIDEKTAAKIQALKNDFNELLDKLFVDWFDRVLLKIQEVAGPILKRIGEIEAVFAQRIDYLRGITERLDSINNFIVQRDLETHADSELDVYDATQEPPLEAVPPEMPPEEKAKKPVPPTPFEEWMSRFVGDNFDFIGTVMDELHDEIEKHIDDIVKETYRVITYVDRNIFFDDKDEITDPVIYWLTGKITFWQMLWAVVKPAFRVDLPLFMSRERDLRGVDKSVEEMREMGYPEEFLGTYRDLWIEEINKYWDEKEARKRARQKLKEERREKAKEELGKPPPVSTTIPLF